MAMEKGNEKREVLVQRAQNISDLDEFASTSLNSTLTSNCHWWLRCATAKQMSRDDFDLIFTLFERSLKAFYTKSNWGYDLKAKKREMQHKNARFVILKSSGDNKLLGYSHFRFDMDEGYAVLYCYEIQVSNEHQRKGIGCTIMSILNAFAERTRMDKIMATVFKFNTTSLSFFSKCGFVIDPCYVETHDEKYDYFVLFKNVLVS